MSIILHLLFLTYVSSSKLNVPRVLLPYNHDQPANFTLKVFDGGCYQWTSSRTEVQIEEVYSIEGCSDEAVVSAVTRSPVKQTAIIIAKDITSGFSLRCDVIIDSIQHLEIVTTTRELYVEEAPEEFVVRAYDEQGNEFSSLEGQEFVWELETITDHESVISAQNVLRFITFEDSPYETPPAISPLERKGAQGYMVLVEGRQTGVARLSVRMSHPAYKHLSHCSVDLMVIANLILEPGDVYVLPQTSVEYSVFHLKQGMFHPVEIRGSQYSLELSDKEIAQMNPDGISVLGLHQGVTSVFLQDSNVKSSQVLKQPTATMHVVEPSYLTITIAPHDNPSLIRGNNYIFLVHLYDINNNKIHLADSLVIHTAVPADYVATHFCTKNGTYLYGVPVKTGKTKITAELTSIQVGETMLEITPPLETSLQLQIYDKISVIPPLTILPWDPETKPTYDVQLSVKGGHGGILWSSSNPDVVRVLPSGNCKTTGKGAALITASLSVNPQNSDTAEIHVKEATELYWLDSIVEVELDTKLTLPVAMATKHKKKEVVFTSCHQMPLKVESSDSTFSTLEDIREKEVQESCASVEVMGKKEGFTKIIASYSTSEGELKAEKMVAAYHPLRPLYPFSGEAILTIGSSRMILFEGGPLPWINKPSGYFVKAAVNDTGRCSPELLPPSKAAKISPDIHAVRVSCLDLGEVKLTLRVGNKPSPTLPLPQEASSSVTIICAMPDSAILQPVRKPPGGSACPATSKLGLNIAHSGKPLPLELTVFDSRGRKFDNISSLSLDWRVSDPSLASFPRDDLSILQTSEVHGFEIPVMVEQMLMPKGLTGELVASVSILGFRLGSLVHLSVPRLEASVPLRLVEEASLQPSKLVLFNHRDNEADINVSGGSGFFKMSRPKDTIVKVNFLQQENRILVKPLSDGSSVVSLIDLCLEADSTPSSQIRVSSITSLDLSVVDRVELKKSFKAEVSAMDSEGRRIPAHSLMDFNPQPQSDIIEVRFDSINAEGNALYNVTGREVGDTTLRMSARKGDSPDGPFLYTPRRSVQVFPPLTLLPRNITLIVGAVYQVETRGGPYPDAKIEFLIKDNSVANTSHSGVVTALTIGTTELTARAVSPNKDGKVLVVYSQDSVTIHVVPLSSLRIHSPLKHLETGSSMPLYAMGDNEHQNPLSYMTASPPLSFRWTINNKQVAELHSVYGKNGINTLAETEGIVRLVAHKPGRVTVSLKVSVTQAGSEADHQILNNNVLSDKLEIKVFESLMLTSPETQDARLLLSPNSETKIQTNRDSEGTISYLVECPGSKDSESPLVSVSSNGVVRSGTATGDATVRITLEEPFGVKQTIVILVEVRPVSYVQMNPSIFMSVEGVSSLGYIPQGAAHKLAITFHDKRGRVFSATNSQLQFRPSRFDLMNVQMGSQNRTLLVSPREAGQTLLQISDRSNPQVLDYIKMDVRNHIDPHRHVLPVASYVSYSSSIRDPEGRPGLWESDSSSLEVDATSGIGRALHIGKASVTYRISSGIVLSTETFVVPIHEVNCSPPSQVLSNAPNQKSYFAPVSFSGKGSDVALSSGLSNGSHPNPLPFGCQLLLSPPIPTIDIAEYFYLESSIHPYKGFGCAIRGTLDSDPTFATLSSSLLLQVVVEESGDQGQIKSDPVEVSFFPALSFDKSEITITDLDPTVAVTVSGHRDLIEHLTPIEDESNPVSIYVESVDQTTSKVLVTAKDHLWSGSVSLDPIVVTLQCVKISQVVKINVSFEQLGPGSCNDPGNQLGFLGLVSALFLHYQGTLFSGFCLLVTVVCLFIGYRTLTGPGYKQTQQPGVFANSSVAPVHTYAPGPTPGKGRLLTGLSPPTVSSTPNMINRTINYSPTNTLPAKSSPSGGISLWSVDREPVYGDPMFRSSPRPAYDGSPTYRSSPS